MSQQVKPLYEFDRFCVDPKERLLLCDGRPVHLESKTFDILVAFVQNSGHLFKKDELICKVWGETFVEEANLAKRVADLRRTLGERPHEDRYVKTEHGQGYRFVAKVREVIETKIGQELGKAGVAIKNEEQMPPVGAEEPARLKPNHGYIASKLESHKGRVIAAGAILVMVALGGILSFRYGFTMKQPIEEIIPLHHELFVRQYKNEYIFHIARSSINSLRASAKDGVDLRDYIIEISLLGGGPGCEVQLWLKTWYGLDQVGNWPEITSESRTFTNNQPLRFDALKDPRGNDRLIDLSHVHAIGIRADKGKCDLQSIEIAGARLIKRR